MKYFATLLSVGVLALLLNACGKPLKLTGKPPSGEPPALAPLHEVKVTHKISYGPKFADHHSVTQSYFIKVGENKPIAPPYPWRVFSRRTNIRGQTGNLYRSQYASVLSALENSDRTAFVDVIDSFFEYRMTGKPLQVDEFTQRYMSARLLRWKKWFRAVGKDLLIALNDSEQAINDAQSRMKKYKESGGIRGPDFLTGESLYEMGELPEWQQIVAAQVDRLRTTKKEKFPEACTAEEIPVLYAPIQALRTQLETAILSKQSFDFAGTEKFFAIIDPIYQSTASLRYDALISTEIAVLLMTLAAQIKIEIELTSADGTKTLDKASYSFKTKELLEKNTELVLGKLRAEAGGITIEER